MILHGWGGLCAHDRATKDSHDAFIVAAGPGAGLVLGFAVLGTMMALPMDFLDTRPLLAEIMVQLVWINIVWSLFNLVPLWPLDGGQLARLAILRVFKPRLGERIVHILGIAMAILCIVGAWLFFKSGFLILICAFLAYENVKQLQSNSPSGAIRKRYAHANQLLEQGWSALEATHYDEAIRIGHQIRAEPNLSQSLDKKAWEIITLGHLLKGELDEGIRLSTRAEQSPRLIAACINAHLIQGQLSEARALSVTKGFRKLPQNVKRELHRRFEAVSED